MKIIEKIEIKNFRSIKKMDLNFDSSVSIFSGVNSCGKTNILRALNLFFNDEVGFEKKLSVSDFYLEKGVPSSSITIKVYFNSYASDRIKKQKKIPEKFSIKKEYLFRSGFFSQEIKFEGGTDKQQDYYNDFLTKWIRFHYIPTDRKVFFKKIHNELSDFLGSPFGYNKLKNQFDGLKKNFTEIENSLNTRDVAQLELSDLLKKRLNISKVGYALPEVHNLLKVLDFAVVRNSGEKGFVSTEGDGVKFINLLQILEIFDSRYLKESRNRPYASIWAIDEPENSLEQKNIEFFKQELWEKHSTNKQIFITSHSPEFLLEPDQIGRNKFYGFDKIDGKTKEITDNGSVLRLPLTEFEREMLIEKMGIGMTRKEKINLKKQIDELEKRQKELELEIGMATRSIVLVEDEYDQIYKIAWLKLNNIIFNESNLDKIFNEKCTKFSILRAKCANELRKLLELNSVDLWHGNKIVGIFDFDKAYDSFNGLKSNLWGPVCGDEVNGLVKKRINEDIFSLLLPVPDHRRLYASRSIGGESKLSIELYFSDKVLGELGNLSDEIVPGVVEKRKEFCGNKKEFWKKLITVSKEDYDGFKPLFNKINELLG